MVAVFAFWCVPYMREAFGLGAGGIWARQMQQRVGGGDHSTIFINLLRSMVNFLPWGLALPLFWRRATLSRLEPRERLLIEAARWPIVICAFALMLIPGMLPRYTLPLVVPYALLLALLLKAEIKNDVLRWPLAAACLTGAGMLTYGLCFASRVAAGGIARDFAAQINAVKPAGSPIYIFDPSVQPEVFYIRGTLLFRDSVRSLPDAVPWLLAPERAIKLLRERFRQSQILAQPREQGGGRFVLLSLNGHVEVQRVKKRSSPIPAGARPLQIAP